MKLVFRGFGALFLLVGGWFGPLGCGDEAASDDAGQGGAAQGGGGASDGGAIGDPPQGACDPGALGPGDHVLSLTHNGLERSYRLHVPPTDSEEPSQRPLVLNFHGFGSSAAEQELFSNMTPLADAEGFIVAYPEGTDSSWNSGPFCCGDAVANDVDDVGFARAVVADIASHTCIDEGRVYATGMSNGGFLSHRLACEAADVFAAVAPVDGLMGVSPPESCVPSRPIPIIHFYGTEDPLVDYELGVASNEHWIETLGCASSSEVTFSQGAATCETWADCDGSASVTFCSIEGMGHCWPGQSICPAVFGQSNVDISANEEMWKLFLETTLDGFVQSP